MRNDVQRPQGGAVPRNGRSNNGFFSLRSLSNYIRIVSSGASTVASTVRSAGASVASSIADRDDDAGRDQVHWAGFDKLECESDVLRQVLLLAYKSGFQVWDVEQADDVRQLVSRHDGPVSFLQMLKKSISTKGSEDKFADVRPLLVVAGDGSFSGSGNNLDGFGSSLNGSPGGCQELGNEYPLPTFVHFYSLRTHDYVHVLKFRTAVYSVRCSPRVVAVLQASQIHCFDAATLEREYTILTYPIVSGIPGSGGIGYGPLAVGSRWLAYSGSPVAVSNTGRVSPQHLSPGTAMSTSPANGSLVAHYAKESSKQLAASIVTLGDMGYKKLSKYCSELLPDSNGSVKHGSSGPKINGAINGHLLDIKSAGMVIVRDIVSKSVVVQFRAHGSPISALCFDPSGTLLVTASIHGHNINVFRIMPSLHGSSSASDANGTYIHLYRLQRGITNAVIQDISFSDDSQWIMISSSRGTSHLFALSPFEGTGNLQSTESNMMSISCGTDLTTKASVRWHHGSSLMKLNQQSLFPSGPPITLSVVSRIRNGSNGWKGAVTGAAAAATGRISPLSGAIASVFHNCKGCGPYPDNSSSRTKYYLLVFSPSGSIIQYVLRHCNGEDSGIDLSVLSTVSYEPSPETDARLVVEALQKWDVCHKRNRRDRGDYVDIYGDHGNGENTKLFQKGTKKGTSIYPADSATDMKVKLSAEENYHLYISEVELQMHADRIPLWAKSEICFQVMTDENIKADNSNTSSGEIEIERIPTRTIEARSKDLIPVFDYIRTPRFQQSRNGPLLRQKSGLSEGRLSSRSSCSSLECMSENAALTELPNGTDENGWSRSSAEANEGFVNNHMDSPVLKSHLEFVNDSEGLNMEAQLESVNNKENLKTETQFSDYDNDFV
ncbi:autophagy-related protein 18f [Elaeis guineensis]|uniref:Autophagy-related protein 18f n=1 Tax=Elaeis guineensis var. tenera TaxID=51953 RepID=A0A6I9RRI5_ELAGV|nr:autophagy-related protein 18f [Elaeis guineensis]